MSYSYDPASIATSLKDRLRFDLQDTDSTDILLQDEEIAGLILLSQSGVPTAPPSRITCLALAARAIATRWATDALSSVGSLSFDVSTRVSKWESVACFWEKRAGSLGLQPPQTAYASPLFAVGMMDDHQPVGGINLAPEDFQPTPMPDFADPSHYYDAGYRL